MVFCINCGQELAEGANFCANCGKAVSASPSAQRKTVYDGELHKCPNCGEILESFSTNCSSCGYELRGANSTSSIKLLSLKLEQLEAKRPLNIKTGNMFSKAFTGGQLSSIDEQKVDLIKNYTIPNTKEDVREFIILASSNIDVKLYGMEYHSSQFQGMIVASQKAVSDAWLAKLEQAYQKAQLLFGDTQEFASIHTQYERKMKEIEKKKRQFPLFLAGTIGGSLLFTLLIWLLVFLAGAN